MTAAEHPFEIFGSKAKFAFEVRQAPNAVTDGDPEDFKGSWGDWRIWVANSNLCELRVETSEGPVEVHEVRWSLAPPLQLDRRQLDASSSRKTLAARGKNRR